MTLEEFDECPLLLTTAQVLRATGYGKNNWPAIAREHGVTPHPASRQTKRWRKDDILKFLNLGGGS